MTKVLTKGDLNLLTLQLIEDFYSGKLKRYTTGSTELDKFIIYIDKTFNLIGGRTSEGKTRFIINLILRNIEMGNRVMYVTGEDSDELVNLKILEQEVDLNSYKLFNKEYSLKEIKNLIIRAQKNIEKYHDNLIFKNVGKVTIKDAIGIMKEAKKLNVGLFIYDHLQTISAPALSVYERHSLIAEEFRNNTKELSLCTIGCVQLNRESDPTRANTPPSIANLKGSGDYEEVAHSCLLIKRKRKKMLDESWQQTKFVEVHIPKNRLIGKCGIITLTPEYTGVSDELLREFEKNRSINI